MSFQKMYGLRGPLGLNMVNQAFRIKNCLPVQEEGEGEEEEEGGKYQG